MEAARRFIESLTAASIHPPRSRVESKERTVTVMAIWTSSASLIILLTKILLSIVDVKRCERLRASSTKISDAILLRYENRYCCSCCYYCQLIRMTFNYKCKLVAVNDRKSITREMQRFLWIGLWHFHTLFATFLWYPCVVLLLPKFEFLFINMNLISFKAIGKTYLSTWCSIISSGVGIFSGKMIRHKQGWLPSFFKNRNLKKLKSYLETTTSM